jgi:hypothetical protein
MTLTTHIAIAAAVTKTFAVQNPVIGFFIAVATHYAADAIPHWDYRLHAASAFAGVPKENWTADQAGTFRALIVRDIRSIALDGITGALAALIVIRPATTTQWLWLGAVIVGGCLPDLLQGLYLGGVRFLKPLQTFHDRMHTSIRLGPYPLIGIPFQALIFLAAIRML